MGVLCGIAGCWAWHFYARVTRARHRLRAAAIAAAIIGGTALAGGTATVSAGPVGAILLGVVSSGLVFFNVPLNWSASPPGP